MSTALLSRRTLFIQAAAVALATAQLPRARAAAAAAAKGTMKTYKVPHTDLTVSRIGYGCASMGTWDKAPVDADTVAQAGRMINLAFDNGITLFDHADIYAYGKAEAAFGEALKQSPGLRDKIVIQSKCGIRLAYPVQDAPVDDPHRMDFSYQHIVSSVEGSLRRLRTDRLDILLLHRPDALMDPDEVAKAFDELKQSGKVRYFGVSNQNPAQMELLKKSVRQPLVANQIQLGLAHSYAIADGMEFNRDEGSRLTKEYSGAIGSLDYCRLHDIQVQAWSPLRGVPMRAPAADAKPEVKHFAQLLTDLAKKKNAPPSAIALAWLLRHPAHILPITAPTKPEHLLENCKADSIDFSREEWYSLFTAGLGIPSERLL